MSYTFRQNMVSSSKYSIKCPYSMDAQYITIHNTSNSASADAEIRYMISNDNQTSFHVCVDEKEVIQAIPFNRNAWHAGDGGSGTGNRKSIGIEIARSTGDANLFARAEQNCAEYVAKLLKERGWGIDRVKRHKDWSGKNCPHKTMEKGWQRFLNMIQAELNKLNRKVAKQVEAEKVKTVKCELKVKFIKQVNIWVDTKFKIVKGHVANGRVVHVTKKTADGNFYVIDGGYVSTSSEFSLCSKMNQKPICKVMPFRDCTLFTYSDGKYGFNQLKAWNVCEAIEYKNGYYHIYMVGWCHESHLKRYALDSLSCTNGVV